MTGMKTSSNDPRIDPDDPIWQRLSATYDELERRGIPSVSALPLRQREALLVDVQRTLNRRAAAAGERIWPVLERLPRTPPRRRLVERKRARARPRRPWRR